MRKIIFTILILTIIFCFYGTSKSDNSSLKDAVDKVIGTKVRDPSNYSVKYIIKDSPTGKRVYDRKGNWLYKIEDGDVYNMKREKVLTIEDKNDGY